MRPLFLARARLSRTASAAALAGLLVPEAEDHRVAAAHRLVWALFADAPDRRRDFLWREEKPGQFMTLSARPPSDPHHLFDLDCKEFAPDLRPGDCLGFTLRANPVVARPDAPGRRGKRHDVVMDALYRLKDQARAEIRRETIISAGQAWLARQGETHGFAPEGTVGVDGYETVRIPRQGSSAPIRFGRLDISGILTVRDVARFSAALAAGFGRSRAFGCGLMLIRRAPLL